ncbi:MAG: HDIG domain-containing protein [Desulfurivibrio sp.]|nr:HDIG domain-containing protein [Desulfurivibrio sp.]
MTIPSPAECQQLMAHYRMPAHIRAHSLLVGRVAELLARALRQRGVALSVELTLAGALLHDIAKVLCLEGDCGHAELGGEICRKHGYPEVAPLVTGHVLLETTGEQCCDEREIVYYADKRVNHDRLVDLNRRRDDIIQRYAADNPRRQELIQRNFARCRQLEEQLFARLDFSPAELAQRLREPLPASPPATAYHHADHGPGITTKCSG